MKFVTILALFSLCWVACADDRIALARVAMQSETANAPGSISEREYLEAEISHERQERIASIAEQQAQRAIAKEEVDRRLEEMNKLRAQIDTERGTFFGVKEQAQYAAAVDEKMVAITGHVNMGLGGVVVLQAVLVVGAAFWANNRKRAR